MLPRQLSKTFFNLLIICLLLLNSSCTKPNFYEKKFLVYGTILEFKFFQTPKNIADEAMANIIAQLNELNSIFHPWQNTVIKKFNNNHIAKICDDRQIQIIYRASHYEKVTNGFFNPAIGALIEAWGFHTDEIVEKIPDDALIDKIINSRPSLKQLNLNKGCLEKVNHFLQIDLGGMIKGYALDLAKEEYQKLNIKNVLTNFGGNIYAHGHPEDRFWEVAIQDPYDQTQLLAKLKLPPGSAIGTSGNYEKYFINNGKRYSHLINPTNGSAFSNHSSATVFISPQDEVGVKSDVFSKPFYFSSDLKQTQLDMNFNSFFVTDLNRNIYITESMLEKIEWIFEEGKYFVQGI